MRLLDPKAKFRPFYSLSLLDKIGLLATWSNSEGLFPLCGNIKNEALCRIKIDR